MLFFPPVHCNGCHFKNKKIKNTLTKAFQLPHADTGRAVGLGTWDLRTLRGFAFHPDLGSSHFRRQSAAGSLQTPCSPLPACTSNLQSSLQRAAPPQRAQQSPALWLAPLPRTRSQEEKIVLQDDTDTFLFPNFSFQ